MKPNVKTRPKIWTNWSGSVRFTPREIALPATEEEMISLVRRARERGTSIRVIGSGHSFTPLVETDSTLVSLDRMQGVQPVDPEEQQVSVLGGTKLKALGASLLQQGWSPENLGDIDAQSIAGAVSTGTHGTGMRLGSLSEQAEALTLITADGQIRECSAKQDPDLYQAARASIGSLGIITRVRLRVEPLYRLHFRSKRLPLDEVVNRLEEYKSNHRHFEFFWFPYTDSVQAKFMNKTDAPPTRKGWWSSFNKLVLENGVFWFLSEGARIIPRVSRTVSRIAAWGVPQFEETGDSQSLFATPRHVRFNEMEYSIPAESLPTVIEEMKQTMEKRRFPVHFPIEIRFVKGDDIWLSPAFGRDSAFVAVHMYKGMPYKEYFQAMEQIFLRHDGRPHWGKMHHLGADELCKLYPRWQDFQRIRRKLDPDGLFLNPHLRRIFGL
ncbi:FAD-binding oxidoreductase [Kroppenstedtia guangzhouensis]|uniref:FAD-binding oxidoreductase n=1 Tax=Kroppenstedtia guangzhouensis TaxID=1274356 RepID=A0ABQ1GAZ6_9BACL|nr:D-arabinono-1,4-lactone oxidase [Kroppenstedtia guangzhouensis]GGA40013.1 FAD-binding oxidoreductase [Kroppenstedtia guangzhouensis]